MAQIQMAVPVLASTVATPRLGLYSHLSAKGPLIHSIIVASWRPTAIRAVAESHEKRGRSSCSSPSLSSSSSKTESRKILLSDVVVRGSRRVYWGRKWNFPDISTASVVLAMHLLCLFAPFTFSWPAFCTALSLYLVTGLLGITLSFHRNLSHRSFNLPKWLEYTFAYCGVQASLGGCGWLWRWHCLGVRIVWVYHITWLVNSACHVWGRQSWNTGDLSRKNWWVALLAFGEGWHNNHHAFEYSARHGLEWWQLDFTWYVIWLLQAIGLATDVKVPSQAQKQRMSLNVGTPTM